MEGDYLPLYDVINIGHQEASCTQICGDKYENLSTSTLQQNEYQKPNMDTIYTDTRNTTAISIEKIKQELKRAKALFAVCGVIVMILIIATVVSVVIVAVTYKQQNAKKFSDIHALLNRHLDSSINIVPTVLSSN